MRPIRITGVTGSSGAAPLDVYTIGVSNAIIESGTPGTQQIQYTLDDPYTIAAGSLTWTNTAATGLNAATQIPSGARAIRGTNMIAADTLVISQQGIR